MKLSDQVEAATGADRELDAAIGVAIGRFRAEPNKGWPDRLDYIELREGGVQCYPGNGFDQLVPHYTASIDAGLTLVPEGLEWEVCAYDAARDPRFGRFQSRIKLLTYTQDPEELGPQSTMNAATPALALCAAALRARGL